MIIGFFACHHKINATEFTGETVEHASAVAMTKGSKTSVQRTKRSQSHKRLVIPLTNGTHNLRDLPTLPPVKKRIKKEGTHACHCLNVNF
jgi:hypothetical protein